MASSHTDALRIAGDIASEACTLLRDAQKAIGPIRSKTVARDLVTEWDTRIEELILQRLGERSPGVAVLAEESGAREGAEGSYWLVDPIDGTVNFAHGHPHFAVAISLEEAGNPVAAVVAAPMLDWTFEGIAGGGATMNGEPMQVSAVDRLEQALLATGFPYDRAETRHNFAQWEHFQCTAAACRRFGVASLDLCMVARGWFDGYWETRLNPWDVSAGALFVREAGGLVTGIRGEAFRSMEGHAIASNGRIHDEILRELGKVGFPTT
jgi:myo-inositol-1(or 4)-monophosphatase